MPTSLECKLNVLTAEVRDLTREFANHKKDESEYQKQISGVLLQQAESITKLADNTNDLVVLWKDAQSVVRLASWVGKVGRWLASLMLIGVAAKALADYLK